MPEYAAPVALGIKVPTMQEGLAPISTMLDLRGKAQQIQQGGVQLEQSQMDLQERNALRSLSQNIKSYQTKDGGLDLPKLVGDATQVAPKLGMDWAKSIAGAHAEGIAVNRSLNAVGEERRAAIGKVVSSVADQPYAMQEKVINSVVEGNPGLKYWGDMALKHLQSAAQQGPEAAKTVAQKIAQATMGVHEQQTPSYVSTGGELKQVSPSATAAPQSIPNTLPPTAQKFNPTTNAMEYVGSPAGAPGTAQPKVQAGPALGVQAGVEGPIAANNEHYKQVQSDARDAQTRISALQTIQQEAHKAVTGGGDYRRAFLAQASGAFGLANDKQTATDVMAKNLALIASQSGNTDASRMLGEMGNPNYHMTEEAAKQTGNALLGIEKKKIAAQEFFSGIPTNDPSYPKKMAAWNKAADPRLFEFAALPDDEYKKAMDRLSPSAKAELKAKALALHKLGVTP